MPDMGLKVQGEWHLVDDQQRTATDLIINLGFAIGECKLIDASRGLTSMAECCGRKCNTKHFEE